ncbi:MAG: AraC family transcriptional regulator [Alistipes sp.]|nr:AraC family transcriptional regulator [Alistipes sp.]
MKEIIQQNDLRPVKNRINKQIHAENKVIRTLSIPRGKIYEDHVAVSEIVFVIDGAAYMDTRNIRNIYTAKGTAMMMPIGSRYRLQVLENLHLLICTLDENIRYNDLFMPEAMPERLGEKYPYRPLQMNEKLWHFVSTTLNYLNDGLSNDNFLRMKVVEMFHILRAYYPRETVSQFFLPLLTKDAKFANFIYENWASAKTLNDLAGMLDLSLSGFTKKFKKVFGMAPYKWIMDKKAERIYTDLRMTDKSLKNLSVEYNFCSVQHFCDYCKKKFGLSPGRLRNQSRTMFYPEGTPPQGTQMV